MCLGVDRPALVGTLVRVLVCAVDGRPAFDTIARVTRCDPRGPDRHWLGLAFLARAIPDPGPARPDLRGVAPRPHRRRQAVA
jgi:hypothetical protein